MKLLSDFDGVWTNQEEEVEYVRDFTVSELSRITGRNTNEITMILSEARSEMDKERHRYGWRFNGEIPAYYGEDPFGDNNAVFDFVEQRTKEIRNSKSETLNKSENLNSKLAQIRRQILEFGFENLNVFANHCFTEATRKFKDEGKLKPHEHAKETIEELVDAEIELVIASNSSTEKIEYVLGKLNIPLAPFKGGIRCRGNAMKFGIENNYEVLPHYLEVSENYKIPLRRKSYHELLHEEMPDYVLGDVFSLDIALPLYLIMNDDKFKNMKVIMKIQPHTPEWVREFLARREFNGKVYLINDIREISKIVLN